MKKYVITGMALALSTALTVGCSNTADGARKDAEIAAEEARRASERAAEATSEAGREAAAAAEAGAERAVDATRRAGEDAARATEGAVEATGEAMNRAGAKADAAQQTADIKSALMADTTVDSTRIDVDTNADTMTVTLNGSVPTAAQKTRAEQIAREKATGYKIVNRLSVR